MIDNTFLYNHFNIKYLKPYQELIIDYILKTEEAKILAVLPTGSGKSLCFMYPLAYQKKKALLIYPLKSLMNDQKKRFDRASIPSVVLSGGLEKEERNKRLLEARKDDVSIITNIETILSLMGTSFFSILQNIPLLIIDEVHTTVTWGNSFRSSFLRLPSIIEKIKPKGLLAFTATLDREIGKGIRNLVFNGKSPYVVHASSDRENIFYHSLHSLSKIEDVKKILGPKEARPAIIFCSSREQTERTAEILSPFFNIKYYHAALSEEEKKGKENWFFTSSSGVLSATCAYGMGVDKENIRTVIHMSLPADASSFLQEAGRGGRDGKRMDSYVLWKEKEESVIDYIFKGKSCIRSELLKRMDEEVVLPSCLSCSSCAHDHVIPSGLLEIISFIKKHPFLKKETLVWALKHKKNTLASWKVKEIDGALEEVKTFPFTGIIFKRFFIKKKEWYNFLQDKNVK